MKRMKSLKTSLLVTSILVLGSPALAAPNPLAPLARLAALLTSGMTGVLRGKDPARAFAPLAAVARSPFGPDVKTAGVDSVRLLGMELELIFYGGETPTYYLRTAVAPTRRGLAFVQFAGRELKGPIGVRRYALSDFKGPAAPLAAAARNLMKAVAGNGCGALPMASPPDFAYLPPEMAGRASKGLEHAREDLAKSCKTLPTLKPSKVEVRIDDLMYAALDKSGKMVGLIKAGWVVEGDRLTVRYGRFRPPPPPAPPAKK